MTTYRVKVQRNGVNDQSNTLDSLTFDANPNGDAVVDRIKSAFRDAAEKLSEWRAPNGFVTLMQDSAMTLCLPHAEAFDAGSRTIEESLHGRYFRDAA